MHRIDHPTADVTDPLKPLYTEGNPTLGVPATVVTDDWLNDIQENIMRACELAGVIPTKGTDTDLYNALVNIAAGSLGLRAKDILTYSTTTALTNSVLGSTVIYNGTGAAAFTLPTINTPANNCPKGTRIEILNQGTGALTITRGGADTFRYNGSGTATTIATLPPGGNIHLESDGTSNWHLAQGTLSLQYGDHLGKTAAQFDATALLATNEFVQRALGNRRGYVGLTSNTNLTAAHAGMNIYASTSTGEITLSLPAANALPAGASFRVMNTGVDDVHVSRVGGDTIVTRTTSDTVTNITLKTGDWVEIASLGTGSLWYHAGGNQADKINIGTEQATTSGTIKNFTGIPAAAKRITVLFSEVSLSGTDNFLIQIGAGSLETSGYVSSSGMGNVAFVSATNGFIIFASAATRVFSGSITLTKGSGNKWYLSGVVSFPSGGSSVISVSSGYKELSGAIQRLSILATGTNNFDNGHVNITWE